MGRDESRAIGFSATEHAELLEWFEELEDRCGKARQQVLASQLSIALESYMDNEKDILSYAFLAAHRKRSLRRDSA